MTSALNDGERERIESWLVAVLMDRRPAWSSAPAGSAETVLAMAQAEGVVALLHKRLLASASSAPETLRATLATAAQIKAAQNLYQQAQCRAILARLSDAGIPALLLKGSALAYWAYEEPHLRECSDIDLLLPTAEAAHRAVELIAPLGYTPFAAASAGDLVDFEICCMRSAAGVRLETDIHWHLSNAPLFAFRFGWDELLQDAISLPALAPSARGLAPVPALLHACMHRVQHRALGGPERLKWLYDLIVLGRRFGTDEWRIVQEQAIARGLAGSCLDGLRAAEMRFGAFAPVALLDALAAAARGEPLQVDHLHRWWYFQRMNWQAFASRRQRWRWLRQRLFPNPAYLRARHGAHGMPAALWRRLLAGLQRLRE